jgi:hypothetical protein
MLWEMKRWTKYVGGATEESGKIASLHFQKMKLKVKLKSCAETELAKLFETTYRAWMIACFQEMHRISRKFGADFDETVDFLEDTHRLRFDRPIMFPGVIRGHCLIPNTELVSIIMHGKDFDKTTALASSLGLRLKILPKVPHVKLNEYYWSADVVIDRFALGSLGMVSLEAIACGRPAIAYVSSEYEENKDFPLKDLMQEEAIASLIRNLPSDLWEKEHLFLEKHHDVTKIESRLLSIYEELTMK